MNPDTNRLESLTEVFKCHKCGVANQQHYKRCLACGASLHPHVDVGSLGVAAQEQLLKSMTVLLRPDGTEVPKHWSVFKQGELVVVKDYTFKVAYMNDGCIMLEPVGPCVVGQ